jgi:hypothetical protein
MAHPEPMKMTHAEPTAMPFVEQVAKEQTERKAVVNATGRQRNPGSAQLASNSRYLRNGHYQCHSLSRW